MYKLFKNFTRNEDGAVTVDWVVLTAAVVALAGVAITALHDGAGGLGNSVGEYLSNTEVE